MARQAVRASADRLGRQLKHLQFQYLARHVVGDYVFLLWRTDSADVCIEDGADSFVIRDGRIVMQSVFYRIKKAD